MSKLTIIFLGILIVSSVYLYIHFVPKTAQEPAPTTNDVKEEDIVKCVKDSDCLVVPYNHCCGASKKAINKKYESLYFSKPEWQSFNDQSVCSRIGLCPPDNFVTEAICSDNYCNLKR
ncbi:MAG: hypothetical protein G01um101416_1238 [Microgenomates group bacterium Gr01-1014_16]|nr:MAG: hypothetical protein G01um101416_1238 [Microgenomates group bacterium Gr01-1014_16]